ncbi:MAG: DUF3604 domain-containing protein [Chloroflexi bacterium]|nr:DUF3604 domain-containing protein [Chloroflexota bacterium]
MSGPIFYYLVVLGIALLLSSGLVLYLRWQENRWWVLALGIGAALVLYILAGGSLRVAQSFYWVNKNPDVYAEGRIVDGIVDGETRINPEVVERSSYQTLTLTFRVGEYGIKEMGGIILRLGKIIPVGGKPQFYDCFYQDMWEQTLQISKPSQQGYATVRAPDGAKISLSKPSAPPYNNFLLNTFAIDAARHRKDPSAPIYYPLNVARRHEIHLKLVKGSLKSGDRIELVLGDTSNGGSGWKMPDGEADVDFVFYVDQDGDGFYRMVSSYATLEVGGRQMASLEVLAPSTPSLQNDFPIVVKALDKDGFLSMLYGGTITFSPQQGLEFATESYTFSPSDRGVAKIQARVTSPDTYRIKVRDDATGQIYASNPILVDPAAEKHIYWGDLHQHTTLGKDANRTPQYVYERNRRIDRFDFASISIHDLFDYWGLSPSPEEWQHLLDLNEKYNVPGEFVTFDGFEWTDYYQGHRNIYYAEGEDPILVSRRDAATPENLRQALESRRYLVIPHHTAWRLLYASVPYNWGPADWEQLRLVEIFSKHGSSDYFDSPYPIHHDITPLFTYLYGERSHRAYEGTGSYVREALAKGYRLGFTAGGDNHWARGGKSFGTRITKDYQPGLQAIFATNLTRESLFDAMWQRHTYATTGSRIVVDFQVNGYPMGSEIFSDDTTVTIYCSVKATAPLKCVEMWKYSSSKGYELFSLDGKGQSDLETEFKDEAFDESSFYFARIVQTDGHLAWASPVWVDK